ncbi:MAG: hypothetical protein R6W72_02770, partial [Desulfurivibrionaceae bacterium]
MNSQKLNFMLFARSEAMKQSSISNRLHTPGWPSKKHRLSSRAFAATGETRRFFCNAIELDKLSTSHGT